MSHELFLEALDALIEEAEGITARAAWQDQRAEEVDGEDEIPW
jgi:hypothetical protein